MNSSPPTAGSSRIAVIDRLRGLVIVLMALDHTRGFFQPAGANPQHLETTTAAFFFIRWVTHLCAPTFLLLAGVSIWLASQKTDHKTLRGHVARRGLLLMLLETTWVSFSWSFGWGVTTLGVLWAIGGAMVLTSLCIGRDPRLVGLGGLLLLVALTTWSPAHGPLGFLCTPQRVHLWGHPIQSVYVILPWFAVMASGYGLGPIFTSSRRRVLLGAIGAGLFLAFVGMRALNGWGDPTPWSVQNQTWKTLADALDPTKYPPSLAYLCMTLGIALSITPLLEHIKGSLGTWLEHYGKAALFFYLIHLPLLHVSGMLHATLRYGHPTIPKAIPLSLPLIGWVWVGVVIALYPACRWWISFKRNHRARWPWLTYI